MDPKYRFGINAFIILHLIYITYEKNIGYFDQADKEDKEFENPFNNYFYLFIYLYLWLAINLGWKIFGIMVGILVLFLMLLIYTLNRTGMGPPLAIIVMFLSGFMYQKIPIDEFKNSSNVEKVVHALIIIISGLMIYLYSYSTQPKMKGFALVTLVIFLNTIAILYGARDTGIAPGIKLGRVFKWLLYILIISSIVWYNTYGTVGSYTQDSLYDTFDPRRFVKDRPDIIPFNFIPTDEIKDITDSVPEERSTEETAEASQKEERREISQDYYD